MKTTTNIFTAFVLFSALMVGQAMAQQTPLPRPQTASATGQEAPDFSLSDQNRNVFHFASYRGKKVLLMFYRGYWCPYCVQQLRDFSKHKAEFDKLNIQMVAISVDDQEHALLVWTKVIEKQFPILSDSGAQVIRKYGLLHDLGEDGQVALRTTLLVDENGKELWRRVSKTVEDIP